jgi:hypothetical protein
MLQNLLLRYAHTDMMTLDQTAMPNAVFSIEEREAAQKGMQPLDSSTPVLEGAYSPTASASPRFIT